MVCHDLEWMDPAIRAEWKGLASLIMVHRHTLLGAGKTRSETSYYMSSLKDVRAPQMLGYVRGHWAIENSCHWVLDAIYREDHNQTRDRNSAANHSILRRMALNAHNRMPFEGKKRKSLPKRELHATHDSDYLEQLLSLMLGPCLVRLSIFLLGAARFVRFTPFCYLHFLTSTPLHARFIFPILPPRCR